MSTSEILLIIAIVLLFILIPLVYIIRYFRNKGSMSRNCEKTIFITFLLVSSISVVYGFLIEAFLRVFIYHGMLIIFLLLAIIKGAKIGDEIDDQK